MSKRDKGALIEEYEARGFLAVAVRNYISLLGWNPKDEREKMNIDEIIELFDFPGLIKATHASTRKSSLLSMQSIYGS